jgi:hypothetical protein
MITKAKWNLIQNIYELYVSGDRLIHREAWFMNIHDSANELYFMYKLVFIEMFEKSITLFYLLCRVTDIQCN